jgi:hypothetical protein
MRFAPVRTKVVRELGNDETLSKLASKGLKAVSVEALPELSRWCQKQCVETGDARYCLLSDSLDGVFGHWRGGVSVSTFEALNDMLMRWLPRIIDAPDAPTGAKAADELRREVLSSSSS